MTATAEARKSKSTRADTIVLREDQLLSLMSCMLITCAEITVERAVSWAREIREEVYRTKPGYGN